MTIEEAVYEVQAFIKAHGLYTSPCPKNSDGSTCHACDRRIQETKEAEDALSVLENALKQRSKK